MGGQSLPWLRSGTRLAKASLDPGEATGWDVGDRILTCSLPVVFLPKSFHQPPFCPTLRLSSPLPTPRLSSKPFSLPNRLSSPPYNSLPVVFHRFMFSWIRAQPSSFTHRRRLQRMKKNEEKKRRKSLNLEEKTSGAGILWRRRLTTQNPLSFSKEVTNKKKRKHKKEFICTLRRENPSSLSKEKPQWRLSGATSGTKVFHW